MLLIFLTNLRFEDYDRNWKCRKMKIKKFWQCQSFLIYGNKICDIYEAFTNLEFYIVNL